MLLGFHAFGRIVLNLVEIKTNLMMAAANAHPFGHFWLVAEETLRGCDRQDSGSGIPGF